MIGIVIVAHGRLAQEYKSTMQHVVGDQSGISAVQIEPDYIKLHKEEEIRTAMLDVDQGDGVVLVTDLYGSSPSNLCMAACVGENTDTYVLYGANVPMLVKLAESRARPIQKAVSLAVTAGRKHLDCKPSPF